MTSHELPVVCRCVVGARGLAHGLLRGRRRCLTAPGRVRASGKRTVVQVRTAAPFKQGSALEAPARANVGQFVGAAARGGSEFIVRHQSRAQRGLIGSRVAVALQVRQRSCVFGPVRPNPSIEWTNNGGRFCSASAAMRAPLFAARVERWASQNPLCTRPCAEYGNAVVLRHAHGCGNNGLCSIRRRSLVRRRAPRVHQLHRCESGSRRHHS
jgi:hypothetical protein